MNVPGDGLGAPCSCSIALFVFVVAIFLAHFVPVVRWILFGFLIWGFILSPILIHVCLTEPDDEEGGEG